MMKKTIPKLVLKRESVRRLIEAELAVVIGGGDDEQQCGFISNIRSGCGAAALPPEH